MNFGYRLIFLRISNIVQCKHIIAGYLELIAQAIVKRWSRVKTAYGQPPFYFLNLTVDLQFAIPLLSLWCKLTRSLRLQI